MSMSKMTKEYIDSSIDAQRQATCDLTQSLWQALNRRFATIC